MQIVQEIGSPHDERSVKKGGDHMKRFFGHYSSSYETDGARRHVKKMLWNKHKCIGYLKRIQFRLPNDVISEQKLNDAVSNIQTRLEIYMVEASERSNVAYFPETI